MADLGFIFILQSLNYNTSFDVAYAHCVFLTAYLDTFGTFRSLFFFFTIDANKYVFMGKGINYTFISWFGDPNKVFKMYNLIMNHVYDFIIPKDFYFP